MKLKDRVAIVTGAGMALAVQLPRNWLVKEPR